MPLTTCLICGTPCDGPRCAQHTKSKGYGTGHWQRLRAERLLADGRRCQLRHEGCTGEATSVHLNPDLLGDHTIATLDDCLSACAHCHGVEDAPRAVGRPATSQAAGRTRDPHNSALSAPAPRAPTGGGGRLVAADEARSDPVRQTLTETSDALSEVDVAR